MCVCVEEAKAGNGSECKLEKEGKRRGEMEKEKGS